jgi:hypothetical protein
VQDRHAYLNHVNKESGDIQDAFSKLNTNFTIYQSQFDPTLVIDSNADGSYDLAHRESPLFEKTIAKEDNEQIPESLKKLQQRLRESEEVTLRIQREN